MVVNRHFYRNTLQVSFVGNQDIDKMNNQTKKERANMIMKYRKQLAKKLGVSLAKVKFSGTGFSMNSGTSQYDFYFDSVSSPKRRRSPKKKTSTKKRRTRRTTRRRTKSPKRKSPKRKSPKRQMKRRTPKRNNPKINYSGLKYSNMYA